MNSKALLSRYYVSGIVVGVLLTLCCSSLKIILLSKSLEETFSE